MSRFPWLLAALLLPGSQAPAVAPVADAPVEVRAAIARADALFTDIRSAHLVELTSAVSAGGNGGAMAACHLASGQIIDRTKHDGIAIGRTSDRLRNPTNVAPAWAAATVAKYAGAQASRVDGFYVDLGDRIGVLRPVAEVGICAGCHGPTESLEPAVRSVLKDRYPADKATGFKDGELRGWLWAELPKGLEMGSGFPSVRFRAQRN